VHSFIGEFTFNRCRKCRSGCSHANPTEYGAGHSLVELMLTQLERWRSQKWPPPHPARLVTESEGPIFSEVGAGYRVFDFFLEVIPRKRRLNLILNLDFEDCDDPSQRTIDATEYAFITHASESGGVLFSLENESQVSAALNVVRQAYEKVSE